MCYGDSCVCVCVCVCDVVTLYLLHAVVCIPNSLLWNIVMVNVAIIFYLFRDEHIRHLQTMLRRISFIYIYIYTHTHTYIYIYIYTHTHIFYCYEPFGMGFQDTSLQMYTMLSLPTGPQIGHTSFIHTAHIHTYAHPNQDLVWFKPQLLSKMYILLFLN